MHKPSGSVLFREGQAADGIYLVLKGTVRTTLGAEKPQLRRDAIPGSLLGVPGTVTGRPYSISALVSEDADLVHVSRDKLIDLMRKDSAVAVAILDVLSAEVREMRQFIKNPGRV